MTTDNFCFYLQYSLIQASQTGGQWYSDTSPFSIPWSYNSVPTEIVVLFYNFYECVFFDQTFPI
jgi:hypothetical protein